MGWHRGVRVFSYVAPMKHLHHSGETGGKDAATLSAVEIDAHPALSCWLALNTPLA